MRSRLLGALVSCASVVTANGCGPTASSRTLASDGAPADGSGASERSPGTASTSSIGQLQQALGGSCGARNTAFDKFITALAVPDHFPPDSAALLAAEVLGFGIDPSLACVAFGVADMGPTCDGHDACYGTFGKAKDDCDRAAGDGWRRACTDRYDNIDLGDAVLGFLTGGISLQAAAAEQACRDACLGMAAGMFQAVSLFGDESYAVAQQEGQLTPPRLPPPPPPPPAAEPADSSTNTGDGESGGERRVAGPGSEGTGSEGAGSEGTGSEGAGSEGGEGDSGGDSGGGDSGGGDSGGGDSGGGD